MRAAIVLFMLCSAMQSSAYELTYALFYKTAAGEINAADYVKGTALVREGDSIKLYFQSDDCIYLYVIIEDSNGDIALVIPRVFSDCRGNALLSQGQYVPDSVSWLPPLEGPGPEIFHIIGSRDRLPALESLVQDCRNAKREKPESERADDSRQAVMEELRRLTIESSPITRNVKTRMRTVAVTMKGDERYSIRAATATIESLFVKTITLTIEERK